MSRFHLSCGVAVHFAAVPVEVSAALFAAQELARPVLVLGSAHGGDLVVVGLAAALAAALAAEPVAELGLLLELAAAVVAPGAAAHIDEVH